MRSEENSGETCFRNSEARGRIPYLVPASPDSQWLYLLTDQLKYSLRILTTILLVIIKVSLLSN